MAFATIGTAGIQAQSVDLSSKVTGTLPVPNGGLGVASGTTGQFLKFSGTETLASAAVTIPTETYFQSILTVEQTGISNNTITKVNLNSIEYDTLGSWDSTNKRWISTTTGKYFVYGIVNCYNGNASQMSIASTIIKKNGANLFIGHLDWRNNYGGYSNGIGVGGIVNMGSTSDYIELFGYPYANSASGLKFAGTPSGVTTELTIFKVA
jgi:hypothetical protein